MYIEVTDIVGQKANTIYQAVIPQDLKDFNIGMWRRLRRNARCGEECPLNLSARAMKCLSSLNDEFLELLALGGGVSFGLNSLDLDIKGILAEHQRTNIYIDDETTEEPLVSKYWNMVKATVEHDIQIASQLCGVSPIIVAKLNSLSFSELHTVARYAPCDLSLRFSEEIILEALQVQCDQVSGEIKRPTLDEQKAALVSKKTTQTLAGWTSRFSELVSSAQPREKGPMKALDKRTTVIFMLVAGFSRETISTYTGFKTTAIRNMHSQLNDDLRQQALSRTSRGDKKNIICNVSDIMVSTIAMLSYQTFTREGVIKDGLEIGILSNAFKLYTALARELPSHEVEWRVLNIQDVYSLLLYDVNGHASLDQCTSCGNHYYYWDEQSTVKSCPYC